ncbi:MAG: outer membrane beta-barrel protein [Cyclobacteriaceae bacterium]|nr:outer membrane beta-barrel protein [Cyclobacteriaceae bacterium]
MRIYLLAFFALTTSHSFAQEKHLFDLETGPMYSSLRTEGGRVLGKRVYLLAGINYKYSLQPVLAIKTGLFFERKGVRFDNMIPMPFPSKVSQKVSVNYDYIVMPLQLSLKTKGDTFFYSNVGIFLGVLLSQKIIFHPYLSHPGFTEDHTSETRRYDLGPLIETGIGFQFLGRKCEAGLRICMGLVDTNMAEGPNVVDPVFTNSMGIKLGVGI